MRGEAGFPNRHQSNYMYNQCAFFFWIFFFSSGILRQVVLNALYRENNKTILSFRRKRKEQHCENFTAKNNDYSLPLGSPATLSCPSFILRIGTAQSCTYADLWVWSTYCLFLPVQCNILLGVQGSRLCLELVASLFPPPL